MYNVRVKETVRKDDKFTRIIREVNAINKFLCASESGMFIVCMV